MLFNFHIRITNSDYTLRIMHYELCIMNYALMWAFRQAVGLFAISFLAPQAPLKKDAAPIPNAERLP